MHSSSNHQKKCCCRFVGTITHLNIHVLDGKHFKHMVRDEDSAQLMVTKGMACSFGMSLAPMARKNEAKITQNTQKVLALLHLNNNSLPYTMSEKT